MVSRFIGVERLILVEQVRLSEQAGVDITVAKVEVGEALVVDVRDLLAGAAAQHVLEDEEGAGGKEDAAAGERGMDAWLAIEGAGHVDAAAAGDAAHVVELG
jgi:hypothetical protein